jgi:ATP-dependent DNA ligase
MVSMLRGVKPQHFVVDGELAIPIGKTLSFDALQMRLYPAESRIQKTGCRDARHFHLVRLPDDLRQGDLAG